MSKVAVIGSGISGAVCASILANNGISVAIFDSARGPGGRMSHRRERSEDGSEVSFDHGAPCFSVNATNLEVQTLVNDWESRGLVAEWKDKFGCFDFTSRKFVTNEEIPVKGLSFKNSETLSWAYCDSSKPGRVTTSERWVLHSTAKYAELVISQTGFQKPSSTVLEQVAEDLFQEFQRMGLDISNPFLKKAHRWGGAFPAVSIAGKEKCLWVGKKRLAICGDFCVSPNVEGAISSGIAAAANFLKVLASD